MKTNRHFTSHLDLASSWLMYLNCMMMHRLANFKFTSMYFFICLF